MKAQYRILGKLKKLDEKLYRIQTELERIPEEVKKLEAKLSLHREEFNLQKANFDNNEKLLRKAELDLREKEDFIKKEAVVVTVSADGYVKRSMASLFRSQGRGGRGIRVVALKNDD